MSKSLFKIAVAVTVAATAAATGALVGGTQNARADGSAVVLRPVEYAESGIDYMYLDAPKSIFADAAGIIVAERSTVDYITKDANGYGIASKRDITAEKVARLGECLVTAHDGAMQFRCGESVFDYAPDGYIRDFTLSGNTLYVLFESSLITLPFDAEANTFDAQSSASIEFASDEYAEISASAVTVCGGDVFIAADSPVFEDKQDICVLDRETGILTPVINQSDKILSLTALDAQNTVYALTRDKINGYYNTHGSLQTSYSASGADMSKLHAYDGFIYALSSLNALCRFSFDLETRVTLAGSASDEAGYFNMPSGIAAKNSALYIADSINDRIVEYGKGAPVAVDGEFRNAISVAVDNSGTIYVAHDVNKITAVPANGRATTLTSDGTIKQIAVDAEKNIYVLTDRGLFAARNGSTELTELSQTKYKAVTLGIGKYELYALDGDKVVKISVSDDFTATVTDYANVGAGAFSIAVDLDGNVFALTRTSIVRANGSSADSFALTLDGADYELGFTRGSIVVCTVENEHFSYGDIVITDTYKHRIFTVDGSADGLGVKCVDADYEVPDLVDSSSPEFFEDRLIRTVVRDTAVFSMPAETPPVCTVTAGMRVIVPYYVVPDFPEYSFVIIEKLDADGKPMHELVQGYVYKEILSDALPYAAPNSSNATAYGRYIPVYKWPTPSAKTLEGCGLENGERVELLEFVADYTDDYGNKWYRVRVGDDCEGYVIDKHVSLNGYEPVFIRPAYNAEIVEFDGNAAAQAYTLDGDGNYIAVDGTSFEVGTQVEIVGVYDSSEPYTQIKYLDPERGTLTCYVRTGHIKYTGVNLVTVVALIVIIITLLIAAVIIARVFYVKRKRLAALPGEK